MSLLSLSALGSKLSKLSSPGSTTTAVNGSPDDRVIRAGPLLLTQGSGQSSSRQSSSRRHRSRRKSSAHRHQSPTPHRSRSSSRTHPKPPQQHRSRARSSVGPESQATRPRLKAIEEAPKALAPAEGRCVDSNCSRPRRRTSNEFRISHSSDLPFFSADDALQERVRSLVSPSQSSLLTTSTHASSSSGSNSTITQTSYAHSLSTKDTMPSKLQRLRKARAKERELSNPGPKEACVSDKVDVFQFMEPVPEVVKEEKEDSDSSSSEDEEEDEEKEQEKDEEESKSNPRPTPNAAQPTQPSPPPPTRRLLASSNPVYRKHRDSLHSDSGISVRDSSPDSVGRSSRVYRCPTVEAISDREEEQSSSSSSSDDDGEDEEEEHHPKSDSSSEAHSSPEPQMRRKGSSSIDPRQTPHPMHPPPYPPQYPYTPRTPHSNKLVPYMPPQQFPAGPLPPPAPSPPHWSQYHTRPRRSGSESGYDLLASQLCSTQESGDGPQLKPLYRKFEYPQHRILLYLQDEISELEEHLRHLDECIADSAHPSASGALAPESRRADSRWGMGLEHQRTDLLGRLYVKLNQYHQAITQFNSMAKANDAAGAADVASYKAWLREKAPIVDAEVRFLDHTGDLIRLDRVAQPERRDAPCSHHHYHEPKDEKSAALASLNTRQALIVSPAVFILVFLAISSVRHWFARLVVLAIIGAATGTGLHFSTLGKRYFASPEELVACIALYTGVFACISMAMA